MPELRLPRGALARLAFAAAIALAAFSVSLRPRAALADETPAACALVEGRIVTVSELREIAASWGADVVEHHGAAAQAIAAALQAEMVFISDEADALVAFAAEGRVRVFAVDHGCVRGGGLIDADRWERALRIALGDPT